MTIDTSLTELPPATYADWNERRAATLAHARSRPLMYVGDVEFGHLGAIHDVFRLMWMARVFRHPGRCRVLLSPSQYVVTGEAGPLVRAIQNMLSFGGGRVLSDNWRAERSAYFKNLWETDRDGGRKLAEGWHNRRWRYTFSGPIGPRLDCHGQHDLLADQYVWGVRTDAGLWCETYEAGWPISGPFLVEGDSPIAIFAAGTLSSEWFPGLPFDQEDVESLRSESRQRVRLTWSNIKSFRNGEIEVEWSDEDLFGVGELGTSGVTRILDGSVFNRR